MDKSILQTGDIFMTDDFKTASKIVKFLMTAPTVWQHVWRKFFGKQEEVRFYHVGMVLDKSGMIEQQGKVQLADNSKIFRKNYVIWRKIGLTEQEKNKLCEIAWDDLGKGYGIMECIGKTISWITGIKYFSKWFDIKDKAICAIRVAEWYKEAIGETFGETNPNYLTTDKIDNYMLTNNKDWLCVLLHYEKES